MSGTASQPADGHDPRHTRPPETHSEPAGGLEALAREVTHAALTATRHEPPTGTVAHFDTTQLTRATHAVDATALLLNNGHTDFAAGVTRQLFEQLFNMEHLRVQSDRKAAIEEYIKFGLLQAIRQQLAEQRYLQDTGRHVDPGHMSFLSGLLDVNFDEFKGKPRKDGSPTFHASWSGRPISQLAQESTNPMRGHQYQLLYRVWSTEVHGAPAAHLDAIFAPPGGQRIEEIRRRATASTELFAVTLNLFIDLWDNLEQIPRPSPGQSLLWLARINAELRSVISARSYTTPPGHELR